MVPYAGRLDNYSTRRCGLALYLDASCLATHWQMIGENAWGGETDPGRAQQSN